MLKEQGKVILPRSPVELEITGSEIGTLQSSPDTYGFSSASYRIYMRSEVRTNFLDGNQVWEAKIPRTTPGIGENIKIRR